MDITRHSDLAGMQTVAYSAYSYDAAERLTNIAGPAKDFNKARADYLQTGKGGPFKGGLREWMKKNGRGEYTGN
jgi:hypothetical protein